MISRGEKLMSTKRCFLALVILTMVVIMGGCFAKEPVSPSVEDFSKIKIGTPQEHIHEKFGEPSGMLSGLRGDIYVLENEKLIIVYYDNNWQVERITTKYKENTPEAIVE
jgi:hypothetical protein